MILVVVIALLGWIFIPSIPDWLGYKQKDLDVVKTYGKLVLIKKYREPVENRYVKNRD